MRTTSRDVITLAARVEVECWLDPKGHGKGSERARSLHRELLRMDCEGTSRSALVQRINAVSRAAIEECVAALQVIQDGELTYSQYVPNGGDGGPFVLAGEFREQAWGDPLAALTELLALRGERVCDQVTALLLAAASERETMARKALASSHLTALHRAGAWPGADDEDDPVAELSVGERAVPGKRGRISLADLEAQASRESRAALSAASRTRAELEARVPGGLRTTCMDIARLLESHREGSAPAAIALPSAPTGTECDAIASAYENLASALPRLGSRAISGKGQARARDVWADLSSNELVLRVLAGWIRGLGRPTTSTRCELCYRHRATKKRCGEHIAKAGVTPSVRIARAIQPAYVDIAGQVRRAVLAEPHGSLFDVEESEWRRLQPFAHALEVPGPLERQCCILAVQLRRMYSSIGPTLKAEVSELFVDLARHATVLYKGAGAPAARSITDPAASVARAGVMLNLRVFFIIWCANGRPYPRTALGILGRRYDPAHPLVQGVAPFEPDTAGCLARQQAWHLACDARRERVDMDSTTMADLLAEGLSFDKIAAKYGCSHETARQIWKRGARPRVRARIKPYTAKGRQRSPHNGDEAPEPPAGEVSDLQARPE